MTALLTQPPESLAESQASPEVSQRKLSLPWLVISAVTIGLAIQIFYGQYDPVAITWLSVAMLAAAMALRASNTGSRRAVLGLLAGGLIVQFFRLISERPMATLLHALFPTASASLTLGVFSPIETRIGAACIGVAAVCAVGIFWRPVLVWAFGGLVAMHVALGVLLIYSFPAPPIDVYIFGRDAANALVRGHDPYAVRFHDIYWHDSAKHYGPGTSINGWLQYGYPYPPVSLLLAAPGLLAGDTRYAYLLAITVAGIFIATMTRRSAPLHGGNTLDTVSVAAAALLLFLPGQFLVLQCGFSEPAPVFLLAATVWTALRHPRWLAIPLGLLLVCKQYMIFAVPAAWLLVPTVPEDKRRRIAVETIAIGAVVSVPFAAIAGKRFWQSVVIWQFHQPFRTDALSYPALLAQYFPAGIAFHRIEQFAPVAGFLSGAVVLLICLRRLPRTPAGFAAAIGLTLAAFFAFNKQAFCNYYYFVIAAFCIAIAASIEMKLPDRQAVD
jgi:hypothetical protein